MSITVRSYVYWKPTECYLRTPIFLVSAMMTEHTLILRNQEHGQRPKAHALLVQGAALLSQ